MLPGFIPYSRATFMLDLVAVAMVVVIPLLAWSIRQVKVHKNHALHGKVQTILGAVLLVTVLVFEIDMRIEGWRDYAKDSRYYTTLMPPVLYVHLFFAVSTFVLWLWTIIAALRNFPKPAAPNAYSPSHRRIAWLAAIGMFCTAVTGWTFYVIAFMC